jgi:hypothetical protein
MRIASVVGLGLMVLGGCGGHQGGNGDGSGSGSDAGVPDASCMGSLCYVDCSAQGMPDTAITGTVFAPNGTLPLYGIEVYVPTHEPGPIPDGAQCARCSDNLPGDPLAATTSDEFGHFNLRGVPSGDNVPLVITTGKWRRQIMIPHVDACTSNAVPATDTSLPRDRGQGDMPRIAIATGLADSLECLARKLGVADTEITNAAGDGHIQLYAGNGGKDRFVAGFPGGDAAEFAVAKDSLWDKLSSLKKYDIVMLSCEGAQFADEKPLAAMHALQDYANAGGRVFLSHWHNVWLEGDNNDATHGLPDWQAVANWTTNEDELPANSSSLIDEVHNPKGAPFAGWMMNVGGSTVRDQIVLQDAPPDPNNGNKVLSTGRSTCSGVNSAERWVYLPDEPGLPIASGGTQNFQFTTPVDVDPAQRCGKVVFSDMHVSGSSGTGDYPDSCGSNELTPQEKALAFMFFDIASCVGELL